MALPIEKWVSVTHLCLFFQKQGRDKSPISIREIFESVRKGFNKDCTRRTGRDELLGYLKDGDFA
jgi:hypothetical protein